MINYQKLLATLSERPDLANLVRRIDTTPISLEKPALHKLFQRARQNLHLPQHSKERLEAFLSADSIDEDEDVAFELLVDATTVFCIGLFPNLECVDLVIGYELELGGILGSLVQRPLLPDRALDPDIDPVANSKMLKSDYLTSLRQLRVLDTNPELMTEASKFEDLLFLPSLQSFYGTSIEWDSTLTQAIPGCRLGLTEVILNLSVIDSLAFQDLLVLCPSLKVLRIDWASVDGYDWQLKLNTMGDSLRKFGTHLIELDLYCDSLFQFGQEAHSGRFGSLRTLRGLRRLGVSPGMLLGRGYSEHEGDSPDESDEEEEEQPPSMETLLLEGLESLTLYFRYPKILEAQSQMRNIMTSPRLARLRELNVSGAEQSKLNLTNLDWKVRETISQTLVFSR
jgi:hypothetical protein